MFVMFKPRQTIKYGKVLAACLAEGHREGGKVKQQFIQHLGTFRDIDWQEDSLFKMKMKEIFSLPIMRNDEKLRIKVANIMLDRRLKETAE
jgi:hypothetical protein